MIENYGGERVWMNSACDWGVSVPLAVPYAALEMRKRSYAADQIDRLIFQNPARFMSQSPRFKMPS
jgi:predicted metal-dependent TIM-barrel fold hydrolase